MQEILNRTALFRSLSPQAGASLLHGAERRSFARDQVIFSIGDIGDVMYIVLDGRLRIGRPSAAGGEHLLNILGSGDVLGELAVFDPAPRKATATAITKTEVALFTGPAIRRWMASEPEAAWHMIQLLTLRLRRSNDALEALVFGDVPGRVARVLCDLADRFGVPTRFGIRVEHHLTQQQLAEYVGASRERVNRVLSDLASRGVIRLETRAVVITDIDRLRRKVV